MSTTYETFASYDEAFPPDWSPVPSEQERSLAEALWREFPPEREDFHPDREPAETGSFPELDLIAGVHGAAEPFDLVLLHDLDLAEVTDPADQIRILTALDRVECLTQALRARTLMALGGADDDPAWTGMDEHDLRHDVAVARRTSEYAAGQALELSRTITRRYPDFLTALRDEQVSWGHLAVLVERTRYVTDPDAIAAIAARALTRALTRTPGQFATEVEKLVARFDPDAAERHRRARKKERTVWVKRLADGMGMLGYVDDWALVNAAYETIAADARAMKQAVRAKNKARAAARSSSPEPAPDADVVPSDDQYEEEPDAHTGRADALAARVLGTVNPDGSVDWDRAASVVHEGNLVIDFLTLTREREGIALLDGQPVPAEIGRELAAGITAWRRFVTDPATDHLIDVGGRYTDPGLRRFLLARDICRNPVHHHIPTSTRLQMDHAEEAPHGPTSASNCGGLCIGSHQLKTARRVDITDSRADGSCTWTTRRGQVVRIPPRPFLDHPDPPPAPAPAPAAADDDVPPF